MMNTPLTVDAVRVLVVEDDASNRIVITRLLKLAGVQAQNIYECELDPESFFKKTENKIDLVFLDIQLPGKDGHQILKEIRSNTLLLQPIVIALTANVMRQDIEKARSSGFDGFIGKPIDGRRFSQILQKILAGEAVWTIT